EQLDDIISVVAAAQRPDGYLHAHITIKDLTPWGDLYHQHDGYVSGHLYEAAVACYRATGNTSLLDVARKSADQAYRHFVTEKNPGFPGHAEIELALVELHRVTGEQRYLELAKAFIERRGHDPGKDCPRFPCEYFQDHLPIREQDEIRGHAVRAVFFATGVADVALETGDAVMSSAANRLWHSAAKRKMYITGSAGAKREQEAFADDYVLPNNGYCESCAACGLADFAHRMLLLSADAFCADVLERVMYNAVLHGISLDGKSFYYRNPLHDKDHLRGNNWCCCPPNLSRTLMKVGGYAYAGSDNELYVNLYIGSNASIALADNVVTLGQHSEYPWDPKVEIIVSPVVEKSFAINLRIPGWCRKGPRIKINGVVARYPVNKGYASINRTWKANDVIELDLPMPVERMEAHPNIKDNQGLVAIQRGPIVYGLEAFDNGGKFDIILGADPKFETEHERHFLGGVTVIKGKTSEDKPFVAIPFYALANRGKSRQIVWLPQQGKTETPTGWQSKLYRRLDPATLPR
ncbi:MAG: glycoside hydrolase family 127 protein, partial [Planctomycetota bacterium]